MTPNDFAELNNELLPLVTLPAEGEELLELIEDQDRLLQRVALPNFESAQVVPECRCFSVHLDIRLPRDDDVVRRACGLADLRIYEIHRCFDWVVETQHNRPEIPVAKIL